LVELLELTAPKWLNFFSYCGVDFVDALGPLLYPETGSFSAHLPQGRNAHACTEERKNLAQRKVHPLG
jgi:hypothetical protein